MLVIHLDHRIYGVKVKIKRNRSNHLANLSIIILVGGFNPFEKYARQIGSFPQLAQLQFLKKSKVHVKLCLGGDTRTDKLQVSMYLPNHKPMDARYISIQNLPVVWPELSMLGSENLRRVIGYALDKITSKSWRFSLPFSPPFSSKNHDHQLCHPFLPRSKATDQHQKIRSPTQICYDPLQNNMCPKKGLYISIGNASSNH